MPEEQYIENGGGKSGVKRCGHRAKHWSGRRPRWQYCLEASGPDPAVGGGGDRPGTENVARSCLYNRRWFPLQDAVALAQYRSFLAGTVNAAAGGFTHARLQLTKQ